MYSVALDDVVEGLALDGGQRDLLGRGLARAISTSKGAGTPRRTTMDLAKIGKLAEALGVTERDETDAVVSEG